MTVETPAAPTDVAAASITAPPATTPVTPPATPPGTPPALPATPPSTPDPKAPATPPAASAPPATPPATPTPPVAPVVPEKYNLTLPKDSPLDPKALARIEANAKAQGLSQEAAEKELARENEAVSEFHNHQKETLKQAQSTWVDAGRADPEIGGEAFKQNVELAKRVVSRFGTDAFKSELEKTGLGNHPELLRVFTRIGKSMREDQLVIPSAQAGGNKSTEEILYNHTDK